MTTLLEYLAVVDSASDSLRSIRCAGPVTAVRESHLLLKIHSCTDTDAERGIKTFQLGLAHGGQSGKTKIRMQDIWAEMF